MNKIWLLDFDGVINALSHKPPPMWNEWEKAKILNFHVMWSPAVIDCIRFAVDSGVQVLWLSSWQLDTQILPLYIPGLPKMKWLNPGDIDAPHWKLSAAMEQPDDANILWTEDEPYVTGGPATMRWITSRKGHTTIINPNPNHGLIPRDILLIQDWIKA